MKLQKIILMFVLMLTLLLLSTCAKLNEVSGTQSSETRPTFSVMTTLTPILTFTPSPTSTPDPSPTTSIIIPTLPLEEANKRLLDLLANNGSCRLPCLWGITPGKSTYQEAEAILTPLSSLSDFTDFFPSPGDISPAYIEGNLVIYTRVAYLYPESDIISHISFTAEPRKKINDDYDYDFDSEFFPERVSAYMLPHILSEQGLPGSVLISTLGGPPTRGGQEGFYMLLLYPEQGILAHYSTEWRQVGNNVLGCMSHARLQLELYPSGQGDVFFELLKGTDWEVKLNHYKSLEEVTNMSVEEFYSAFREPTDQCVETSVNLWPIPEP